MLVSIVLNPFFDPILSTQKGVTSLFALAEVIFGKPFSSCLLNGASDSV